MELIHSWLLAVAGAPAEEHAKEAYLEQRVKLLEKGAEEKDDEHAKRLRVMQQGFKKNKELNERRLSELEVALREKTREAEMERKPSLRVKELERQLDEVIRSARI